MPEPALQTQHLTRTYRVGSHTVRALDGVNLSVQPGEFVTIMGPSGCGKSTLLNLIGGLDQPSDGAVYVEGHNLATYTEEQLAGLRRAKLGFIFQRHELFPMLTARENVEFPLMLEGLAPEDRHVRASDLLSLVGLGEKAEHLPDELSGGQQQRVGLARALANHPTIILADEPTGNLDSETAREVLDAMINLMRSHALTLVVVTHDPEVATHADRIVRLRDGRLVTDEAGEP
jgi:putative ABC transport system ATP-binding protein